MDYSFEPFLDALGGNWYEDDPLLQRLLAHHMGEGGYDADDLSRWGAEVAGPLRALAEASARRDDLPRIRHYDAFGRRVDRILLPESTLRALSVVEGKEGLGAPHGNPFAFYARGYLYGQNGEAGVLCSLGCTDGMVRVLEALGDGRVHREAVDRVRGSTPERVWHGAQFVTEIQGGSDVPANRVEARSEGGEWRLWGRKWFCSNVNADYFLVTARPEGVPEGGAGIGLFLVPAYLQEGDWRRNGHTVDRLKEKLGTRELATAEVTLDGAVAHPVGPLERGLPNLLRYVLNTSRLYCVQSAASTLRQAERIAGAYAEFRTAFGRPIGEFPLVMERLEEIRRARCRALAAYFGLLRLWVEDSPDFRILLSLAKPVLTMRSTTLTREAMNLLGGNGIEERFSPLPRLYRDAVIMEIWEGPHDVLFTQALRDLERFQVEPEGFLHRVAGGVEPRDELAHGLGRLLADARERDVTVEFRRLATGIVDAFADGVLAEAGASP
jgi:alkylation response protein AidB-like acyl-CoA dehydrogenase